MGADPDHDQPFGLVFLHAVLVGLRVGQVGQRHVFGRLDLLGRAVVDEDRLALPGDGDALADLDMRQVGIGRGQGEHVGGGVHLVDERPRDG